ncbi:MAG: ATP-binding protein [Deltaproteobacteria bacterium]|nr:ATP-binding protein [Deltaproteobacteria bacterium]MBI3295951.1 ATP-binding protein [Deltaproteobacteria bacterium]
MGALIKKLRPQASSEIVISSTLDRRKAAELISQGKAHIHATALGQNDACVRVTRSRLDIQTAPYPWGASKPQVSIRIRESSQRCAAIQNILETLFSAERSSIKENLRLIMEEMSSNAMYHSIREESGKDLYRRTQGVSLKEAEAIELNCHRTADGAYLSVSDHGGTLRLTDIGKCLERCYKTKGTDQMEAKESGAGLGFFMIFENVTHMEISVVTQVSTTISVWLPVSGASDPTYFSFNFWGGKNATK